MEIRQYWNVPRQAQRMTTPSFPKTVEAAVQSLKKGKSAGVDNIPAKLVQAGGEDVITALTTICNNLRIRSGRLESHQPLGPFPRKATCSSARTTKRSASSVTQAKSCWRSYWTDWSLKWRRSSLQKRQASEQEGAPQSRFSTYESSVRNISSKISLMTS